MKLFSTRLLFFASTLSLAAFVEAENYRGQFKQDKLLNAVLFKNKRNGVFIDIGAADGDYLSNSWFFEKELAWKGICFEPMPSSFQKLVRNRKCICINACIAQEEGIVKFRQIEGPVGEMWSGIEANYDQRHIAMIEASAKEKGESFKIIDVPALVLNDVLEKNKIYHIDFLSLDIEGGELQVLKSIDFKKFYIAALTVENNYDDPQMSKFLEGQGFHFIKKLGVDEVYVNGKEPGLAKIKREASLYELSYSNEEYHLERIKESKKHHKKRKKKKQK